jgi:tetratricopeptide (TPR) repeat protein
MKMSISTAMFSLLLFAADNTTTRTMIKKGWEHWSNGDIIEAQSITEGILKDIPDDNKALHLRSLCLSVQGKYREAITAFYLIDTTYAQYNQVGRIVVDAYIHLNEPKKAFEFAKQIRIENLDYYQKMAEEPFICDANKTFILQFNNDPNLQIPSKFFPSIKGKVNDKKVNIRFDTGASFLSIGKDAAEELGISFSHKYTGEHGARIVTYWRGIAEKLELGDGLVFKNIPVSVTESLGTLVIFGTNVLEQFLATIDYPNSRFILTPRSRKDLYPEHFSLLPKKQEKLPFYMWLDHYMFAKGGFNKNSNLNFFFDSGLVAMANINGQITQAPFTASRQKMISWGFDENELNRSRFFITKHPLTIKGLVQENTLIWYDMNLEKDRSFGGIRIDGLISHAFLSKYSWTIDFDKHEFTFGIN